MPTAERYDVLRRGLLSLRWWTDYDVARGAFGWLRDVRADCFREHGPYPRDGPCSGRI
jgi:hypothetical protein